MRKVLSKSLRFEVFKRDKFICQYCGGKAPEVVLNVDHIEPVSKGGTNELVNLITSCFDCNSGKSDRKLADNTVVEKQRKQLELVQERREQIELMFKWKKSLEKLDDQTGERIKKYINAKIRPYTISDSGQSKIKALLGKYEIDAILSAIDTSANRYLKHSREGELLQHSVDEFVEKIGGILFNKSLSPIAQKLARIKGAAKAGFHYYDARTASILLDKYVKALRTHWEYSDEQILTDLDEEVLLKTQESKNWSEWKNLLEGWIESIKKPKENEKDDELLDIPEDLFAPRKRTEEQLEGPIHGRAMDLDASLDALSHILKPFPKFKEKEFRIALMESLIRYISEVQNFAEETLKQYEDSESMREELMWEHVSDNVWAPFVELDGSEDGNMDGWFLSKLECSAHDIVTRLFEQFFFSRYTFVPENVTYMQEKTLALIESRLEDLTQSRG